MLLKEPVIYPALDNESLQYAARALQYRGIRVADAPCAEVTHLLLPVPCRISMDSILAQLPPDVIAIGGGLKLPNSIDLLQDECYLAKNAMITAHIALRLAAEQLKVIPAQCPMLVLGWGRIGKCLAKLLQAVGAEVTVAARKPSSRAMVEALGMDSSEIDGLSHILRRYRVIFNTIPSPVLDAAQIRYCREDCVKLELASVNGMEGKDIIVARGLPGKYAPESSGNLIAESVVRLLAERRVLE